MKKILIGIKNFLLFKKRTPIKQHTYTTQQTKQFHKLESALTTEREKKQLYFNMASTMIIELDRHFKIRTVNKKTMQVLKWTESELEGKPFFEYVIAEEERESFLKQLKLLFQANLMGNGQQFEYSLVNAFKEKRSVLWTMGMMKVEAEKEYTIILSGEDVTERKMLEEQYLQSQKMESIGRLAGGIAHDFNNILTIIIGNADLLLLELDENTELYHEIDTIAKAGKKAAMLTDQLLTFSRKRVLQQEACNLNTIIVSLMKMIKRLLRDDIQIITELSHDIDLVKVDRGQIEQVLLNFSVNARDAMPSGGIIVIATEEVLIDEEYCRAHSEAKVGDYVKLSFSDTGVGVHNDALNSIFEPFYTTKPAEEGTGLGLSVVYGIVKQHEGWITVDSSLEQGTTFSVFLPVHYQEEEEINEELKFSLNAQGHGELVLCVEDQAEILTILETTLTKVGYRVLLAQSISEAKKLLAHNKNILFIISDVVLSDGTGVELIETIENINNKIKVIFISGYVPDTRQMKLITSKGYQFVQKPFAMPQILKLMLH